MSARFVHVIIGFLRLNELVSRSFQEFVCSVLGDMSVQLKIHYEDRCKKATVEKILLSLIEYEEFM